MKIKESPVGRVITAIGGGYQAFIPDDLPPKLEFNVDVIRLMSEADHVLGMLSSEGAKAQNPYMFMRSFIVREAVTSSAIEGTQATLGEVLACNAGESIGNSDVEEVGRHINALNHGLELLNSLPLSLRLIREMHAILMQGDHCNKPGEFRKTQNWIGSEGCTLETAKYVPPSPEEMMECLNKFEAFLHDQELPPLIHAALCHYQFEAIHPFMDGNGRIGRILIVLLMISRKRLTAPTLYLNAFFESRRKEYYSHLYVSNLNLQVLSSENHH